MDMLMLILQKIFDVKNRIVICCLFGFGVIPSCTHDLEDALRGFADGLRGLEKTVNSKKIVHPKSFAEEILQRSITLKPTSKEKKIVSGEPGEIIGSIRKKLGGEIAKRVEALEPDNDSDEEGWDTE
jgi:hypothetical protein